MLKKSEKKPFFFNRERPEMPTGCYDMQMVNDKIKYARGKLRKANKENDKQAQTYQTIRLAQLYHVHCLHNPDNLGYQFNRTKWISRALDSNIPASYMMANRLMKHAYNNPHYDHFLKPLFNRHHLFSPEQALAKAAYWGDVDAVDIVSKVMKSPDKSEENKAVMLEMNALGYDSCRDVTWALYQLRKNYFDIRDSSTQDNSEVCEKRLDLVHQFQEMSVFTLDKSYPVGTMRQTAETQIIPAPQLL